ncbi:MAG: YraN family protein [Flavobacteriales bacterium]|nr:YraN family protein [Flavobacteriales bacterium]
MKEGKDKNSEKGKQGEMIAVTYLLARGYDIKETRWKFLGREIDIIAETEKNIVFVEVKFRYTDSYGEPWEAVNNVKRKRIVEAADAYIRQMDSDKVPRFDIVSILMKFGKEEITHIEEAFWPML